MNGIIFVIYMLAFMIAVILAVKHYLIDIPRKDKMTYRLDAIKDSILQLVNEEKISATSSEYKYLDALLSNAYWIVKHGVSFSFMKLLIDVYQNGNIPKADKVKNRVTHHPIYNEIYTDISEFLDEFIVPSIARKLMFFLFFSKALSVLDSFQKLFTVLSANGFESAKDLKNADSESFSKGLAHLKLS